MTATTTTAARKNGRSPEEPEHALDMAPDPRPGPRAYLEVKRAAPLAKRQTQRTAPVTEPNRLRARTKAEDRSGVRIHAFSLILQHRAAHGPDRPGVQTPGPR